MPLTRRVLLLLALTTLLPAGCRTPPAAPGAAAPPASAVRAEPVVRIRVLAGMTTLRIDGPGTVRLSPVGGGSAKDFQTPLTISARPGGLTLQRIFGQPLAWNQTSLLVEAPQGSPGIQINGSTYPDQIIIRAATPGSFDVINHVGLERYLPGVLDRELYASWHDAAFRAQAVAARSYAIYNTNKNAARPWDMEATTASQMYGGAVANPKANAAVAATRGLVLTWHGKIVPGFYSSTAGEVGQDAVAAFGSDVPDLPPLRGKYHGGWDAISKYFRWGPVSRNGGELARRLSAWGRANQHPIASLRSVSDITVTARNKAGRPTRFTVADGSTGRRYDLACEQFRFAANAAAPGLPAVADAAILRSSNVSVRVVGPTVQFYDGKGFGHGVGLSQWGAQGMALKGHGERAILAFYYPGAVVEKLY